MYLPSNTPIAAQIGATVDDQNWIQVHLLDDKGRAIGIALLDAAQASQFEQHFHSCIRQARFLIRPGHGR